MCALDRLHVEVERSRAGVGPDGCIAGVCEGTGLSIAKAGDVVLIATEVLLFCGPGIVSVEVQCGDSGTYLSLKEQNCWFMTCQTISSDDMVILGKVTQ